MSTGNGESEAPQAPLELGETLTIQTQDGATLPFEVVGVLEDRDGGDVLRGASPRARESGRVPVHRHRSRGHVAGRSGPRRGDPRRLLRFCRDGRRRPQWERAVRFASSFSLRASASGTSRQPTPSATPCGGWIRAHARSWWIPTSTRRWSFRGSSPMGTCGWCRPSRRCTATSTTAPSARPRWVPSAPGPISSPPATCARSSCANARTSSSARTPSPAARWPSTSARTPIRRRSSASSRISRSTASGCTTTSTGYIVATEAMRAAMVARGISAEAIAASGIPVRPEFAPPAESREAAARTARFAEEPLRRAAHGRRSRDRAVGANAAARSRR